MKYQRKELCLIWLNSFTGLEYKHKLELYKYIVETDGIKSFVISSKDYIIANCGDKVYNTILTSANNEYLDFVIKGLDEKGIKCITIESDTYPKELKEISHPPLVLYAKGDEKLLSSTCFAIVGSRKSLPLSINLASEYSKELGKHFTLVTGIAEGVDTAVIKSAIDSGAKVISVIASGFSCIYPASNVNLVQEIVKSGLIISEYPPEVMAKPYFFPVRNRIIAGLSKGVLIVSAAEKSGALYTAEYGFTFGKDVFSIPYSVGIKSGAGCNDLIKSGAILTDNVGDVLSFYGYKEEKKEISLNKEENEIIEILSDGEKHADKICEILNKQIYEITPTLSMLEIKGIIVKNGFNVFGLTKNLTED